MCFFFCVVVHADCTHVNVWSVDKDLGSHQQSHVTETSVYLFALSFSIERWVQGCEVSRSGCKTTSTSCKKTNNFHPKSRFFTEKVKEYNIILVFDTMFFLKLTLLLTVMSHDFLKKCILLWKQIIQMIHKINKL